MENLNRSLEFWETPIEPSFFNDLNPSFRDPQGSVAIFDYRALHSLPHFRQPSHVRAGGVSSSSGRGASGGVGVGSEGMMFEGLYHEPSLGHLVALVRYYVHEMDMLSLKEVRSERPSFHVCGSRY